MTALPASGGAELWERQRPQGRCLSVLIRDRCAPPHPTPPAAVPARTGQAAPLPLQGWAGRVPEGLLARCAQTEKLGATGQRGPRCLLPPSVARISPSGIALAVRSSQRQNSFRLGPKRLAPAPVLRPRPGSPYSSGWPTEGGSPSAEMPLEDGSGVGCGGNGQRGASPEHVGAWPAPGNFPVSLWRDQSWRGLGVR